jgi:hypothetical protein
VADFRLRVTAETQDAERKLRAVDKAATEATKNRNIKVDVSSFQDINKRFKDISSSVKEAGNNIQTFYRFSKNIPGIGDRVREVEGLAKGTANLARTAPESAAALRENAKAGSILANTFESAGGAAGRLINNLAKAGFALFAVKEAVGVLQAAFGGFFNETIGREIKLRETILKTQTTLASTNKVFRNGTEITDPYEKIVALTGEVQKRIDSIRERSIALAGVTSNEVIEVFGMVASQIGQIGGGLKEAEDLAINFAAALGTFGIPLYQARQEIGSILRGDITADSYLAKALGITNDDITRAKSQAGGVVKFLEERLAASVAGQRIAAQGFAGVVSNIRDLAELVNQRFGAGLLDPLLGGLTKIFDFLFKIREEVFAIASGMGRGLGQLLSTNLTILGGGSALFGQIGAGAEGFAASITESVKKAFASLQRDANAVIAPLRNLFEEIAKSVALVGAGLARLAQGFISIKIENFKALVQIFSNLSEAVTAFSAVLGQVLRAYGQLLQVPFVQYLSQISAQFQILEKLGVMSAVKLGFAAAGLIAAWTPIVTFFQGLVARIASLVGGLVIAVGAAFTRLGAVVAAFAATLTATYPAVEALKQQLLGLATSLTTAGAAADKAGVSVTRLGGATAAAARTASTAIMSFVKFNLILLAVQVAITVLVDLFGRFQRAQEEASSSRRAAEALRELQTKYKDVGDAADSATKSARDFRQALVDAEYGKNLDALEKVREKINQIRYELKPGIQSWREFWDALSGSEVGRFEEGSRQALQGLLGEEQRIKAQLSAVDKERDKQRISENIRLEADKRISLEKEIGDLRKQQDDQLFQLRQQRAQKEVDIFRAAGELRIFQMEQANKKLIEGEEGASAAALDALNNYLSVRERGELDIESSKKQLAIEAANLERQISDYRLENEKKIAEIRKRAGDYEKNVSDYRRQLAGQSPVGGATGLTQGNTGTSSSGPHFHVSGAASEAEARAIFAPDIRSQLITTDVPGSPRRGGRRHAGYDLAGPAGTPLNLAPGFSLTNFTRDPKGLGGNYATIAGPNNKSYKVMHLQDPGSSYKGPGSTAVAPQAPSFADVGAPAVEKYASAVRSLSGAMERLRALQEALTNAKTAAAFDEIAKAAFPKINVEQYSDQLIEAQVTLKALAETAGDAYDPEALKLSVDEITKRKIQEREISEILIKAEEQRKAGKLTEAELNKLKDSIKTKQAEYLQQLEKERKLRQQVLEITRQQQAVEDLRAATQKIGFDLQRSRVQGTAAMGDAYAGDDPALKRRAEAEALIAQKRIELEEKYGKNSAQAQEELRNFAASTRAAAGELAKIDTEVADFQKAMALIRESAKTITDGFKGFVKTILTGGDIQEGLVTMLEGVADKFLNMALDAAFKPLEDMLAQNFKDFFGIEDPTQALQAENNAALTANTAALNSVTAGLGGAGAAAGGAIPIPVQPFPASEGDFGGGFGVDTTGEFDLPGLSGTGALKQSAQEAAAATTEQADANKKATESAKGAGDGMAKFGQVVGSLAGIAAGAGAIAGGVGMMQKGGTYNTLMGLAGVFGGIGGIAGGFTGFFRASGGPVSANRPYIVGEKGPELFSPSGNGTITSNQALFSANRGAMGTASASGDPFSENRSAISTSQTALERRTEAERMQRATANPSPIDIRYEAQVINNVEYVTTDQFRSGLNQAAERGRALAYNGIQNSTKVRSRLGV